MKPPPKPFCEPNPDETQWNWVIVARGTSPQFETVTLTIKLTLNGAPEQIASASLLTFDQQGATVPCNIVARYSDGTVVLQAQVPTGWIGAKLVTLDINGIKVSSSLKHPA